MSWVSLVVAVVCEVGGTMSLRATDGFRRRRWIAPMLVGYVLAFVFLAASLHAGMPLGVAYGIWASLGVALVSVLAWAVFGDRFTWTMGVGVVLIMGGVLLVELGSGG